ncbi:MAG: hypothetical protein MJZ82_05010 [Paludibacteraceae bacterium]|nr:hypothetical protein [Paludibacteraceae bacterium]
MAYNFTFANVGGATRVKIQSGEDIRHLGELDQKMWTVLSCPVKGLEIPEQSLSLMDADHDGQLHITEVIRTAEWLCSVIKNPDTLFQKTDCINKEDILDADLRAIADRLPETNLAALDAAIAAITIDEQAAPDAPYAADVIEAYKAKKDEYAAYFQLEKLQKLGLAVIAEDAVKPGMSETEFIEMGDKIAAYEAAVQAAADANAAALKAKQDELEPLRKLLLVHRDFITLLQNYVTFENFYKIHGNSIFQCGTLVIDQRACHLCIRANDMAKLTAQAPQSGMFLLYCDCTNRVLNQSMQIVAAVTMGEIRNLTVGKNAIFYDRQGNDWDAIVTKVEDNPISIRQAFWDPYRKFAKWVTELINKSAAEKNDKAFADMTAQAESGIANASADSAAAPAAKKSAFDIAKFAGIFAAIGMAIGFIGQFLVKLAEGIHQTPSWKLLLILVGIMLLISGPSMLLAWLKLRKRNLAPILNANGWAINADSIISVPFGATLTEQVKFPVMKLSDPFAKKGMPKWKKWTITIASILVALAIVEFVLVKLGIQQSPFRSKSEAPVEQVEEVAEAVEEETTAAEEEVTSAEEPQSPEETSTAE